MRKLGPVLAGAVLVTVSGLLSIWVHVQAINFRYRVSQAYEENRRLLERQAALEVERQMLRAPQRITRIAEEELGMVLPGAEERVVLK
jgi:cell division protein FtsL